MPASPNPKTPVKPEVSVMPPWFEEYRWPLVGAGGLAVVLVVVVLVMHGSAGKANAEAIDRLNHVQTANDLMAISAEYPNSPAAPLAMLKLAKSQYDSGKFDEALKTYQDLATQFREHPLPEGADSLSESAEMGRVHCLEAMGRTEDALKGFEDFQKGLHFLTPQAVIGQARCLRTLGRTDEARVVYEDFITANPQSEWTSRCKELLAEVTEKKPASAEETPVKKQAATTTGDTTSPDVKATASPVVSTAPVSKP